VGIVREVLKRLGLRIRPRALIVQYKDTKWLLVRLRLMGWSFNFSSKGLGISSYWDSKHHVGVDLHKDKLYFFVPAKGSSENLLKLRNLLLSKKLGIRIRELRFECKPQ